jgi:GMP reductase
MDTTGTFEMAKTLAKYHFLVALHKHYSVNELITFLQENNDISKFCGISAGSSESDFNKIKKIIDVIDINNIGFICLDVANGYSESFVKCVNKYR